MRRKKTWDVFICHASEDKPLLVQPLANTLRELGVEVWYDEFTLRAGDSLSRSIDKGLSRSKYGLVLLSRAFFKKNWTEFELRGLTAKELDGRKTRKVIIPIWHNITKRDVLKYSPSLADKLAIHTSAKTINELALEVIKAIKPELFTQIQRKQAYLEVTAKAESRQIDITQLAKAPKRHSSLPPDLISRVRLIRATLLGVYTYSMRHWIDGFLYDAHPSEEIAIWERIAAVASEYTAMKQLSEDQRALALNLTLLLSLGAPKEDLDTAAKGLPADALAIITMLYSRPEPVFDLRHEAGPRIRLHLTNKISAKVIEGDHKEELSSNASSRQTSRNKHRSKN